MTVFPSADASALPQWLAIADLLLTREDGWRKRLTSAIGFPTSKNKDEKARLDAWKARMGDLLARLAGGDSGERLRGALGRLRQLPPARYSEQQWEVLGAIVRLLPFATAQLWTIFAAHGQCDFTEISQAAARALGDDDAPTDLALALDYRISHLLIDEFQDTSLAQFELLEKLTRGWSEGDGRTLMAVGDPMQSIYRFREAEVGLFLNATHAGIGSVSLEALTLHVNFRSRRGIVEWVNRTFSRIMPSTESAGFDEVPYAESVAYRDDDDGAPQVIWHPRRQRGNAAAVNDGAEEAAEDTTAAAGMDEAREVVDIIRARRRTEPAADIAILVRNRAHLMDIVPALKAAGIAFQAVDIDPLKERAVVQDLLALARALLHLGDRIAWLAVLRAPWCGLTLNDLAALVRGDAPIDGELAPDERTVWQMLADNARVSVLSEEGQARIARVRAVFATALQMVRRLPLRAVVESSWLALLGPACLAKSSDLDDAWELLDLLEDEAVAQSGGNTIVDLEILDARVEKLFAGGSIPHDESQPPAVQIMTIHKAKGLEWNTVIVPGLHRTPRLEDRKLLVWTEQLVGEHGESELLLAPIPELGAADDADAIYRYVQQHDRNKQRQENVRLIYVAATRAICQLHLLATVVEHDAPAHDGGQASLRPPRAASLLAPLWPAVSDSIAATLTGRQDAAPEEGSALLRRDFARDNKPVRLTASQPLPDRPAEMLINAGAITERSEITNGTIHFDWAGATARHVGTVVHAFLQIIADEGIEAWNPGRVAGANKVFERELVGLGVADDEIPAAVARVATAIGGTLADPRGRWILHAHADARSEWRLSGVIGSARINVAIDRSFVDENGDRWIIDFKTGGHEGADAAAFLDNEQKRYREQLETYAALVEGMPSARGARAIKLGLYFPVLNAWREWEWQPPA